MANDLITIALDGDVPLPQFATAVVEFSALVGALSSDVVGPDRVEWHVSFLEAGSAVATVRGIAQEETEVERVVEAYKVVGNALAEHRLIPYSDEVVRHAIALTSVLNGQIKAVRFETEDYNVRIDEPLSESEHEAAKDYSLGEIRGKIGTIWHTPLKLAVYDELFDKVVYCFLDPDQEEVARQYWGKRVTVVGAISRDPETGRPLEVRNIKSVTPIDAIAADAYKKARGIVSWQPGDEPAEQIIRRIRDAG